jgi:membrane protein YdbS with pleckstrin-like domain
MSDPDSAHSDAAPATTDGAADGGWQTLPPAARTLFLLSGLFLALPLAIAGRVFARIFDLPGGWALAAAAALAGGGFGAWLGLRRYRYTRWRLDADGFSLRRGRMWSSEVRVPVNRVQHLDLRRGPLERRWRLATLVIHTAGTRDSAVNVGGLAEGDAERLRDLLARQVEHDRAGEDRVVAGPPPAASNG